MHEALSERYGTDEVLSYENMFTKRYSNEMNNRFDTAFDAVLSESEIEEASLKAPSISVDVPDLATQAEFPDDELIRGMVRAASSKQESLIEAQIKQLSADGVEIAEQSGKNTFKKMISQQQFVTLGDCEAVPLVPHEILQDLMSLASATGVISPEALNLFPQRLSAWLQEQKTVQSDDPFFAQEATVSGEVIRFPRFTAAIKLNAALMGLVSTILMQWHSREFSEGLVSGARKTLNDFLVNFQKAYYMPLFIAFSARYGKSVVASYEAETIERFLGELQTFARVEVAYLCAINDISLDSLNKPTDEFHGEGAASSDGVSTRRGTSYLCLVKPDADAQAQVHGVMDHSAERLIDLAQHISFDSLQSTLAFLQRPIDDGKLAAVNIGGISYGSIGAAEIDLLRRVQDPAQTVLLEEINAILNQRVIQLKSLLESLPQDLLYGLVGQESFDLQLNIIANAKHASLIFYFSLVAVLKKMISEGQSVDTGLVFEMVKFLHKELVCITTNFSERHGASARMLVANLMNAIDLGLKHHCPQSFE